MGGLGSFFDFLLTFHSKHSILVLMTEKTAIANQTPSLKKLPAAVFLSSEPATSHQPPATIHSFK